ncbi:MAG: DUF2752 domain-containing protein [Cyclobacteriaceae bacterium]|nr:DUF2752 domain-containing protein [Cyclobacteriaceae bacterium]
MTSINYTINQRARRKLYGMAGAFFTLAIPYFIMLHSHHTVEAAQSFCPFKMATGFPCPGCGITKSFIFLYTGDLIKSFSFHLFGPLAFLACIATLIVLPLELITGREFFQSVLFSRRVAFSLAIGLGVYHLMRVIHFVYANSIDEILRQSIWK